MATTTTAVLDNDLDGGPENETIRSGIGGTDDEIDLSDRGRITASIVQQYQAATGGRYCRPSASLIRTNAQRPVNDVR